MLSDTDDLLKYFSEILRRLYLGYKTANLHALIIK